MVQFLCPTVYMGVALGLKAKLSVDPRNTL